MISLSRCIFPTNTIGARLDSFARRFLWDINLDYSHGTGHGVGCCLNVHEGLSLEIFLFKWILGFKNSK